MEVTAQHEAPRRFNPWVGSGADMDGFVEEKISWSCQDLIPGPSSPCLVAISTTLSLVQCLLFWFQYRDTYAVVANQFINDRALTTSDCRQHCGHDVLFCSAASNLNTKRPSDLLTPELSVRHATGRRPSIEKLKNVDWSLLSSRAATQSDGAYSNVVRSLSSTRFENCISNLSTIDNGYKVCN
jgi:hypothetical protein